MGASWPHLKLEQDGLGWLRENDRAYPGRQDEARWTHRGRARQAKRALAPAYDSPSREPVPDDLAGTFFFRLERDALHKLL